MLKRRAAWGAHYVREEEFCLVSHTAWRRAVLPRDAVELGVWHSLTEREWAPTGRAGSSVKSYEVVRWQEVLAGL